MIRTDRANDRGNTSGMSARQNRTFSLFVVVMFFENEKREDFPSSRLLKPIYLVRAKTSEGSEKVFGDEYSMSRIRGGKGSDERV